MLETEFDGTEGRVSEEEMKERGRGTNGRKEVGPMWENQGYVDRRETRREIALRKNNLYDETQIKMHHEQWQISAKR